MMYFISVDLLPRIYELVLDENAGVALPRSGSRCQGAVHSSDGDPDIAYIPNCWPGNKVLIHSFVALASRAGRLPSRHPHDTHRDGTNRLHRLPTGRRRILVADKPEPRSPLAARRIDASQRWLPYQPVLLDLVVRVCGQSAAPAPSQRPVLQEDFLPRDPHQGRATATQRQLQV